MVWFDEDEYYKNKDNLIEMGLQLNSEGPVLNSDRDAVRSMLQGDFAEDQELAGNSYATKEDYVNAVLSPVGQFLASGVNLKSVATAAPVRDKIDYDSGTPVDLSSSLESAFLDSASKSERVKLKKDAIYRAAQLQNIETAVGNWFERRDYADQEKLPVQKANELAEIMLGTSAIKFDKPKAFGEVMQSVEMYRMRKEYEDSLALIESGTQDYNIFNNASFLLSGIQGGTTLSEILASTAAGFVIEKSLGWSVGLGAGLGRGLQAALKVKKVADVAKNVRRVKNINKIQKALSPAASAAEKDSVAILTKTGLEAAETTAGKVKLATWLEKLPKNLKEMGYLGHLAVGAAEFTASDLAIINFTKNNSDQLGFDLYTDKDAAMDTLVAFGLGGLIHMGAGKLHGFNNIDVANKAIRDAETEIDSKVALGQMEPDAADHAKRSLGLLKKEIGKNDLKEMPKFFEETANELKLMNLTDAEFETYLMHIRTALKNGNKPKISDIPLFQSLMTRVPVWVIDKLKTNPITEVFGKHLVHGATAKGLYTAHVPIDKGLLGRHAVTALTQEEADEQLKNLYFGQAHADLSGEYKSTNWVTGRLAEKARASYDAFVEKMDKFVTDLEQIHTKAVSDFNANVKNAKIGRDKLVNLYREMFRVYMQYKFPDMYEMHNIMRQVDRIDPKTGMMQTLDGPKPVSEIVTQTMEEFEEWSSRFIHSKPSKDNPDVLFFDFIDATGKEDKSGRYFAKYLEELRQGVENNKALRDSNLEIQRWNEESIKSAMSRDRFDVSLDTNTQELFGIKRVDSKEAQALDANADNWANEVAIEELEYNKIINSSDNRKVMDALKKFSPVDTERGSEFRKSIEDIDRIRAIKKGGWTKLQDEIIGAFREDSAFQNALKEALSLGKVSGGLEKLLPKKFKSVLATAINKADLDSILGRTKDEFINECTEIFKKSIQEDPKRLRALLTPENLKENLAAPTEAGNRAKALGEIEATKNKGEAAIKKLDALDDEARASANPAKDQANAMFDLLAADVEKAFKDHSAEILEGHNKKNYFGKGFGKFAERVKSVAEIESKYATQGDELILKADKEMDRAKTPRRKKIIENRLEKGLKKLEDERNKAYDDLRESISKDREEYNASLGEKQDVKFSPEDRALAKVSSDLGNMLAPIMSNIDIELSRALLQRMHYVTTAAGYVKQMMELPQAAAEVLTGAATQTLYTYTGSKRSVEYLTRTAGFYFNDIRNSLYKMESQTMKGKTLLEYFEDKSNRKDIMDAITLLKHGQEGAANSDAARIAKEIVDREATFNASFRKYGARYKNFQSTIDRKKMRFIDAFIQDQTEKELAEQFLSVLPTAEDIIGAMERNELGQIRRGTELYAADSEELLSFVNSQLDSIKGLFKSVQDMGNPVYRKMVYWMFRDLDLDKTIDSIGNAEISLNTIRDLFLEGKITDFHKLIGDDIQNLAYIQKNLRMALNAIVGLDDKANAKGFKRINGEVVPGTNGMVYKFRTGYGNLAAVLDGKRSAAIDMYESNLHFKNAQAEMALNEMFGYDSVAEYIHNSFEKMFQAFYALENFTDRPDDLITDCIQTYNTAIKKSEHEYLGGMSGKIEELARNRFKNAADYDKNQRKALEKFEITQSAAESVRENVHLACGLQNNSPASGTRVLKAIKAFLSAGLLVKAGFKSLADHATIWEGFITNGMVGSLPQAWALAGKASRLLATDRDLMELTMATSVLTQETIVKKMSNDPAMSITGISKGVTREDWLEMWSQRYANWMMNSMGKLEFVTNLNKNIAGLGIQFAVGKNADRAWASFTGQQGDWFKKALIREGIDEYDWDFLRVHACDTMGNYITKETGKVFTDNGSKIFVPLALRRVPDEVFIKEMYKRGIMNITPERLKAFRAEMYSKAWNLVDTSADEMVSLPSERITNVLRGGKVRNSGWGEIIDAATQYQSFGLSMLNYTYGRRLANFAANETGISIIDLLNPAVRLQNVSRFRVIGMNLIPIFATLALTNMVIEAGAAASIGQVQYIVDDDDNIHYDSIRSAMFGALGSIGVLLDTCFGAFDAATKGGINFKAFPALSNLLNTGYRLGRPLTSSKIRNKGEAFTAAAIQEAASFAGLRNTPGIAILYQSQIGAWLDSLARGGRGNYFKYLRDREKRRGIKPAPWEANPTLFGGLDSLQ